MYSSPKRSGRLKSHLDRRQLPGPTDRVAHVDVDLRPVEGARTLVDHVGQRLGLERETERVGGVGPALGRADRLALGARRQLDVEVLEAEAAQHAEHEAEQGPDLLDPLLVGAEDVAVVLREAPDAHEAVQDAAALVAVHRAQLVEAQRQLLVGPLPAPVHEDVHRAVHRLRVEVGVLELHRRPHVVVVVLEVPADLEQVGLRDVRREHHLVAGLEVALPAVVLHQLADDGAPGVPDGQAAAQLVGEATGGPARWPACGGRAWRPPRARVRCSSRAALLAHAVP